MISSLVSARLEAARDRTLSWIDNFSEEERRRLAIPEIALQVDRAAYVDGWRRIRRTTPMILRAIERFDARGDEDAVAFWVDHLDDEIGHDKVMRDDLLRMFGSEANLDAVLAARPMSPPSVALVGYFEWQVGHGEPDLLIVLRLYLEWFFATMSPAAREGVHALIDGGSRTLEIHAEADQHHLAPCFDYLERRLADAAAAVQWSLDFVALCLNEAQTWTAAKVLGEHP